MNIRTFSNEYPNSHAEIKTNTIHPDGEKVQYISYGADMWIALMEYLESKFNIKQITYNEYKLTNK